jgi:hypothetical protein
MKTVTKGRKPNPITLEKAVEKLVAGVKESNDLLLKNVAISPIGHCQIELMRRGRFTISTLTCLNSSRGLCGVGIARKSDEDVDVPKLGIEKSLGRAVRALRRNKYNRKIHTALQG